MAELHLYDFDGTLFRAPDRPDWWGYSTWIMKSPSLGPPCVPQKPGSEWWISSAVSDAKRSIADPDVWAILCTGRALGSSHRYRVPELLKQKGLSFDEVYLNDGGDTKAFKIKVILKLLQRHPAIDTVHIWENHLSNMAAFCQAVERAGRACVQHPITVKAQEPICTEDEMLALEDEGWAKPRRVAARWVQALRIEQRRGEFPTKFWRTVLTRLCERMGVNHSKLKVQFRKRLSNPGADADYGHGIIRIRPIERSSSAVQLERMFESLAHELQHAKQQQTGRHKPYGRSEDGESGHLWEGVFYPKDTPYREMPWEVEAFQMGPRFGPPLYREMKKNGEIPLSQQQKFRQREPFTGPTLGDLDVLTPEEIDEDIAHRKSDMAGWKEKWRERFKTGWRGLEVGPEHGRLASTSPLRVAARFLARADSVESGAEYLSAKLTPMAQAKLLRAFPALHSDIRADHMTVWYDPPERILGQMGPLLGKQVRLKVVGYAEDEKGQAVVISTRLPIQGRIPHVTLSTPAGGKAVYSNELLAKGWRPVVGPTLDAVIITDR